MDPPRSSSMDLALILGALGAKYVIFVTARRNRISTLTEFCKVTPAFPKLKKRKENQPLPQQSSGTSLLILEKVQCLKQ